MKILVVLVAMYLAGAILNAIQICRLYHHFEGELPYQITAYTFFLVMSHPLYVIVGTRNSFRNWDWMFERFYRDENGELQLRGKETVNDG